jgi:hypothetical protein
MSTALGFFEKLVCATKNMHNSATGKLPIKENL